MSADRESREPKHTGHGKKSKTDAHKSTSIDKNAAEKVATVSAEIRGLATPPPATSGSWPHAHQSAHVSTDHVNNRIGALEDSLAAILGKLDDMNDNPNPRYRHDDDEYGEYSEYESVHDEISEEDPLDGLEQVTGGGGHCNEAKEDDGEFLLKLEETSAFFSNEEQKGEKMCSKYYFQSL